MVDARIGGSGRLGAPRAAGRCRRGGDDQAATEGLAVQHGFIEAYNARNWDQVGDSYAEDAIALTPNHEPILGRAAIVEYWKGIRDTLGEAKCGEPLGVTAAGNLVALVSSNCTAYADHLRFITHELYERGADGVLRYKFDMFGLR